LLQQSDVTRYIEKVTWRLAQEDARANKFLHKSSVAKVIIVFRACFENNFVDRRMYNSNVLLQVRACCEDKMVAAHVDLLHSEAEMMIKNESRRDLALLYPLLRSLPGGLDPLVQHLTRHITLQGLQAIGPLQGENVSMTEYLKILTNVRNLFNRKT